jgi:RNase P/RNase MRP subunit POP5
MLKRREKRRYISVRCAEGGASFLDSIHKRHEELFGSIAAERASIRLIKYENGETAIIRCSLGEVKHVLAVIALCNPPAVSLDMSSSMKRLKRRL